jgi:nicotinate-nucleotide adenylyltransferase
MRRLCFGGSFNPIHHGHLICARAVAEAAGFDRIVLIPSRQPPHKQGDTDIAPATDRLAICRAAVQGDSLFEIDDIELHRSGPSYTIDTAQQLRHRGWPEVNWLIGADMARYLPHWHESARLLSEVHFLLMARPGWSFDWLTMPAEYRHLERQVIPAPLINISSTDIRRRIAAGQPITYMTPPAVVDYIRQRGLYRETHP